MIVYRGYKVTQIGGQSVTKKVGSGPVEVLSAERSLEVCNHSPTGFNWGYGGSGPAQLALALLLDVTGDADVAYRHYQAFKWQFVCRWGDRWEITDGEIKDWLNKGGKEVCPA